MATKVFMEALSPTMEEGRLVKWLKNEGDAVKNGDVLAEVETDKAVMELAARGAGVLRKRLVNEGEAVPVGTLVGVIGAKDEDIAALIGGPKTETPQTATEDRGPKTETRSAAPPVPVARPATVPPAPAPVARQMAAPPAPALAENGGRTLSSPLAKRLADERGLDLARVVGSGPGGRIVRARLSGARPRSSAPVQ